MLRLFALTTILLTCADHWTTYLCLHAPVQGWTVAEANPVAEWLFDQTGLAVGLAIDTFLTFAAIAFLVSTGLFDHRMKVGLLGVLCVSTGYAVFNNLGAIHRMGLAPWLSGVA